uniref:Pco133868b n=1 Tax=Arundo donax TaxID=35708 RepID=A0A0A9CUK5_ARUDO
MLFTNRPVAVEVGTSSLSTMLIVTELYSPLLYKWPCSSSKIL